ncbi:MAG: cadherin-like domain-containing protein, partial [Thermoguttaceae bacterium]
MTVNIAAEQAPVVSDGSLSMVENQTLSLTTADFTADYSDPNANDPLQVVEIIALPQQGTLAMCGEAVAARQIMSAADLNELTYQPAANYTGPDAFTWNGCDGQLYAASSAAMDIDVAPDKAPIVTSSEVSVVENESLSFTATDFTANFSDPVQGNTLQAVQITSLPQQGTLVLVTEAVTAGEVISENELGNLTYQPNANYTGPDSFQWTASDGQLYAATPATLGITVTVDVPPVVSDSSTSVAENSSLMFTSDDFTDNFTDAEP